MKIITLLTIFTIINNYEIKKTTILTNDNNSIYMEFNDSSGEGWYEQNYYAEKNQQCIVIIDKKNNKLINVIFE